MDVAVRCPTLRTRYQELLRKGNAFAGIDGSRSAAEAFFAWLQREQRNGRSRHDRASDEYLDVVAAGLVNYARGGSS